MFRQQFLNSIPQEIVDLVVKDYESRNNYETSTMNKTHPGDSLFLVLPYCQKFFDNELKFKAGNFYKHTIPYFPHTDFRINLESELNVVIPLQYTGEQASLVIFDQAWMNDSVTWCLNHDLIYFSVNTGVKGKPSDYPDVQFQTSEPIDEHFYFKYLTHEDRDLYFGMSGVAFPFQPTSIMAFDNRLIHCTSKFKGEKLGLSLRFSLK